MSATRTQVASYLARELTGERQAAVERAAAWLIRTGRTRDIAYLARDTAHEALEHGYLYAVVTSALEIGRQSKQHIEQFLVAATHARDLEIVYKIDPARLGGVHLDLPDLQLDATLRTKLDHFAKGHTHE